MNKSSKEFHLIFEDGDPLRAELVKSVLEAGEVDCFIENGGIQNMFSLGSLGGFNPLIGTAKVFVRAEERARAEALLADLPTEPETEKAPEPQEAIPPYLPETPKPQGKGFLSLLRQWFSDQLK